MAVCLFVAACDSNKVVFVAFVAMFDGFDTDFLAILGCVRNRRESTFVAVGCVFNFCDADIVAFLGDDLGFDDAEAVGGVFKFDNDNAAYFVHALDDVLDFGKAAVVTDAGTVDIVVLDEILVLAAGFKTVDVEVVLVTDSESVLSAVGFKTVDTEVVLVTDSKSLLSDSS